MPDRISTRSIAACAAALLLFLLPSAHAQDASISASTSTSTARAARLTFMQGAVTVNEAGNTGIPAQMNLPLLAGVQLATGVDGQAEVEFEDGSVARLTPNSVLSLDVLAVDPSGVFTTNLSLLHGLAYFELRATPQYVYTVNAGGDVLSPVENTTVRVDFDEAPASFAVLDGTAQVQRGPDANSSGGYETDVRAGESLRADAANPSRYFLTEQIAGETWDQWNADMDQNAAAESAGSTAVRNDYAGAQGYGWSDLDANGTWYNVPGQEPVWQPQAAMDDADFDPYGNGAWVWYPGTGYLWASGYMWGWTPYRCGTWGFYNSFGWGWTPGAACGGFGWGFLGGGFPVNIGLIPRGYRPIHVPVGRPGPGHPILPIRPTHPLRPAASASPVQRGPRTIGGITARPIAPVTSYVGGGAAGGTLRRDFPIDRATHTPALGLDGKRPATVYTVGPGTGPANGAAPGNRTVPGNRTMPANRAAPGDGDLPETIYGNGNGSASGQQSGVGGRPAQGSQQQAPQQAPQQQGPQRSRGLTQPGSPGQGGGQPQTVRPAPTAGSGQSGQQQRGPEQRQAAPPPHYSPPPQAPRPSYTPPPPHFSPPPPPPHVSSPPPPPPAHK